MRLLSISHVHSAEDVESLWGETLWTDDFEEPQPLDLDFLERKIMVPLHSQEVWNLLTAKMKDWTAYHSTKLQTRDAYDPTLSLRPLFDAPAKWTPAPDGSLLAHVLASLAHGEGEDTFDRKFIAATNNLIKCFRDMVEENRQNFEDRLKERGYGANRSKAEPT